MTITPLALIALSAAPGGHATLHPESAVVYVEAAGIQAVRAAWTETPLARLLADEDVHAALGAVFGGETFDPREALAGMLAAPLGGTDSAPTLAELLDELVAGSFSVHAEAGGIPLYVERTAQVAAAQRGLAVLADAVSAHAANKGALPEALADVDGLTPGATRDPWGRQFAYARSGSGYALSSLGLDGEPGGAGSGADIDLEGSSEALLEALLCESFGFQLALELDSAETAARALATLAEHAEKTFGDGIARETLTLANGDEAAVLAVPALPTGPLRIIHHDTHLVLIAGKLAPEALAQRLAGVGASLSGHAALGAGSRHFAGDGVVALEGFSTLGDDFLTLVEPPFLASFVDVLDALFGPLVTMLARGGHWRLSIDDGQFVTEGFHPLEDGAVVGVKPLAEGSYGLVHPGALCGWLTSVDLPRITTGLLALGGEGEVEEAFAALDEKHGFRPDRDLLAPLGSTLACSLPPLRSLMSAPDVQLALELNDREAFVRGMDGLKELLLAELGEQVAADAADYKGARIYTFSFKGLGAGAQGLPFDPSAVVRPTVVVLADRILVTTLPGHGKREVRRLAKSEAGVHPTLTPDVVPEDAAELVFADWATFFGKLYTSARLMAPMLAMGGTELPFDPNALPAAEVFTEFFRPSLRYERRLDGGVFHRSASSFGPDLPVALVGAGWLGWSTFWGDLSGGHVREIQATIEPPPEPVEAEGERARRDAREATASDLARLKVALQVYRFDTDAYPEKLLDLERGTAAFPNGFLDGLSVPRDGWGREFEYTRREGGYRLWSVGPDGVDQAGAGDDVPAG